MIDKMQFISLTGPREDFDRVIDCYISKYDIQLENAMSELKNVKHLRPFTEPNPYKDLFSQGKEYLNAISVPYKKADTDMDIKEAVKTVTSFATDYDTYHAEKEKAEEDKAKILALLDIAENFKDFHYSLDKLESFKFIRYRFGRMPIEFYNKFQKYVYNDLDTIFTLCKTDKEYAWGVYMAPAKLFEKIDAVFASLHFEEAELPKELHGTPEEAIAGLKTALDGLEARLETLDRTFKDTVSSRTDALLSATRKLETVSSNFELRKFAACTGNAEDNFSGFFILCGWLSKADAKRLKAATEKDGKVFCVFEDYQSGDFFVPPTKLKNARIFKPFEMYVRMYGVPNYNEFDPTVFVALTYSFIFGAMFGDVGQGILLFIGGMLLYRIKKMNLAAIVATAGIFSTIFGFLFGSIFGFEDIIKPLWLRPISNMTNVPFIGKLNTVFVFAIGFGMLLVLLTMILNVINGLRAGDYERSLFDTNGIAGLVFYGSVVLCAALFMAKKPLPATIVLLVMFVLPLIIIAFKEPLTHLITKRKSTAKTSVGMFITQSFFELFEVLLSYFSNTLSFVRIGAFAVSHAAMMEVVLMLAGAENGGTGNIIVIILGNLFVCGMEGLIVGIQVLRLEYYELFSRFYKGNGREFTPTIAKKQ